MDETSTAEDATPVTILGRTYRLRGGGDSEYVTELAALVDERMREIERATGTADTLKVAILTSLNLADDYLTASRETPPSGRKRARSAEGDVEKRLARMVALLDEALAG